MAAGPPSPPGPYLRELTGILTSGPSDQRCELASPASGPASSRGAAPLYQREILSHTPRKGPKVNDTRFVDVHDLGHRDSRPATGHHEGAGHDLRRSAASSRKVQGRPVSSMVFQSTSMSIGVVTSAPRRDENAGSAEVHYRTAPGAQRRRGASRARSASESTPPRTTTSASSARRSRRLRSGLTPWRRW